MKYSLKFAWGLFASFAIVACVSKTTSSSEITDRREPAAAPPAVEQMYCMDPVRLVCQTSAGPTRQQLIDQFAEPLKRQALQKAADAIHWSGSEMTVQDIYDIKGLAPGRLQKKRRKEAFRTYFETLHQLVYQSVIQRMGGETKLYQAFQFRRVQNYLKKAVELRVRDRQLARKITDTIDQVELVDVRKVLNLRNNVVEQRLADNYYDGCGHDGLDDNAFAFELEIGPRQGKRKLIVPCAGAVIASMLSVDPQVGSRYPFWVSLLSTFGHETGHHFDGQLKDFTGVYNELLQCIRQQYGSSFQPEEGKSRSREQIVMDHFGEITADSWGAAAVALYLQEYGSRLSPEQTAKVLQASYSDLCNQLDDDDGVHPTGRFRIQFGRDEATMFQQMSCGKYVKTLAPRCSL